MSASWGSLRVRLTIIFVVLFFVVFVIQEAASTFGIPGTSYIGSWGQNRESVFRNLSVVADQQKQQLDDWLGERRSDIEHIARDPELITVANSVGEGTTADSTTAVQSTNNTLLGILARVTTLNQDYDYVSILDPKDNTILVSINPEEEGQVFKGVTDGEFSVEIHEDVRVGAVGDYLGRDLITLPIIAPVRDKNENVVFLLNVGVDIESALTRLLGRGGDFGQTGEVVLVGRDGAILAPLRSPLVGGGTAKVLEHKITAEPAALAVGGFEGIVEGEDYRDETVLAAYRHIQINPSLGWGMVVKRDRAELFSATVDQLLYSSAIGAAALLLVAVLTVASARRLTRALDTLTEAARKIAAGKLGSRTNAKSSGEIGELADTFNGMAERIQQHSQELTTAMLRAEESDQLKSAFLASMSHELRTPLNSIIGLTGVLLQEMPGPLNVEQTKQLDIVRKSSNHLLDLINDVLDISKIEAGQLELYPETFRMKDAIDSAIQTVAPLAAEKNLPVLTSIQDDTVSVYADKRRVEQVIVNLLNNAIKFTDGGKIVVSCEQLNNGVFTSVRDTGAGIPTTFQDQLFMPFRQIDSGLARKGQGTGLGLSICKRLIEMSGGTISFTSREGHGSTFTFVLSAKAVLGP